MKTKLITALRTAAKAIDDGTVYYEWVKPECCNCGVLFCALTGKSIADFRHSIPKPINGTDTSWTTVIGQYCPITGMPTNELFKELYSYGLTQSDMINLEFLSDETVVQRVVADRPWWQTRKLSYKDEDDLVEYMRAWADILTEEGQMDSPAKQPTKTTAPHQALASR